MQNNRGLRYSAVLHAIMLLFLLFGLPSFLERKPDPEPSAVSVDILPIAPVSNVKPQEETPEKPVKQPVPKEQTAPKAAPPVSKETAPVKPPEPVKETPKETPPPKPDAVPLPKPEKTPPPKPVKTPPPKPPEKPKKEEKSFESLMEGLSKQKVKEDKTTTKPQPVAQQHKASSDHYDSTMPLSMSEMDGIRQQYEQCWSVPAGAKDAQNLVVTLSVELNEDGTVINVKLKGGTDRSNPFFQAAADAAIRAVRRCSPLKNLPSGKYGTWKELELSFDPKNML